MNSFSAGFLRAIVLSLVIGIGCVRRAVLYGSPNLVTHAAPARSTYDHFAWLKSPEFNGPSPLRIATRQGWPYLDTKRLVSFHIEYDSMIADPVETLPAKSVGRPRSEGCRQKVLAAADTLFTRDGLARMSVDAVAQQAGVSKATIYRWWPNKAAIVMEALLTSSEA